MIRKITVKLENNYDLSFTIRENNKEKTWICAENEVAVLFNKLKIKYKKLATYEYDFNGLNWYYYDVVRKGISYALKESIK